jgi:predicted alpha/beta superfamily hydrolase
LTRWLPYQEVHGPDHTVSGTVLVWPALASPQLGGARDIVVYLPPSLADAGPQRMWDGPRYPVLYFHDGQNVFDERTSNSGEWRADETLEQLAGEGIEAIAVAIPNGGHSRMDEYNPWRSLPPGARRGIFERREMGGRGDAYLGYLVGIIKPLIDRSFPTRQAREGAGVIGSSMGGLISLYALAAYPAVFGLAGVMSPSLAWSDYRILGLVEAGMVDGARIHLDAGGREWPGMIPDARRLRDLLIERGFPLGRELHYVEERHAGHHEAAWARRLPDALRFLLSDWPADAVRSRRRPEFALNPNSH